METENIKISQVCGLCAGCKHAIDTSLQELQNGKKVTLFKEVVHNKNVNNMLETKGVSFENDINNLNNEAIVIVRAHGEPKSTFDHFEKLGINYVDCTCVNVKKIHEKVFEHSSAGHKIIIIGKYGKKNGIMHPEIAGTVGWCTNEPILIEDEEDCLKLEKVKNEKLYLVCQTTFNMEKAELLIEKIKNICDTKKLEIEINKSICFAQKQINIFSANLAKESDLMIVVGGKNSSNSTELFNNVKSITNSIFIEDINNIESDLEANGVVLSKNIKIGLTAGASTMKSELEYLKKKLEKIIEELV